LPFYPHFSSEEDHRRALEAARVGVERLLKALRDGRYNARREYGEALEYYLADLPTTAGAGNILLANDQVRILHDMFLADASMLSEGLASRLKSVIANQFALNAFYDLVQRHNEAVNAGNWSRPFPLDEAKSFFGAVETNTPRWFEPRVEQGLRQVEQAEPPPASTPEPPPASVIAPRPLPPGTPDAQNSWKRQMATAANAVWETFLQGRDMPLDKDEWRRAADELGPHVRPIIEFLRAQERPNGATRTP
jgi:predicted component of type VI protein secretion system